MYASDGTRTNLELALMLQAFEIVMAYPVPRAVSREVGSSNSTPELQTL